jgi:hypothetical protein
VDEIGHTRILRFLLVRGASRDAEDKFDRKPIDLVSDNITSPKLQREVRNVLKEPSWTSEYLMTRTPLKKLKKNWKGVFAYFMLFWVTYLLEVCLVGHSEIITFYVVSALFVVD